MSQSQVSRSISSSQPNLREEPSRQNSSHSDQKQRKGCRPHAIASDADWDIETVLETTNNRLQELMQLLYLLSRDPALPNEGRYHVTIAQSEIALLTRQLQNSTSAQNDPGRVRGAA